MFEFEFTNTNIVDFLKYLNGMKCKFILPSDIDLQSRIGSAILLTLSALDFSFFVGFWHNTIRVTS